MITVTSHFSEKVVGEALIPGDKSISHRSLMIGASAIGETKVKGLLEEFNITKDEGDQLIMEARKIWLE